MPGVYKVRVGFGRDITMMSDEIVLLDRDHLPGAVSAPQLASPAPIQGSAATHEFHEEPFADAADRRGPFSGPAAGQQRNRRKTGPTRPTRQPFLPALRRLRTQ